MQYSSAPSGEKEFLIASTFDTTKRELLLRGFIPWLKRAQISYEGNLDQGSARF